MKHSTCIFPHSLLVHFFIAPWLIAFALYIPPSFFACTLFYCTMAHCIRLFYNDISLVVNDVLLFVNDVLLFVNVISLVVNDVLLFVNCILPNRPTVECQTFDLYIPPILCLYTFSCIMAHSIRLIFYP